MLFQFQPTDVTDIDVQSEALSGCLLYFCDYGERSKSEVEIMVKRLGGKVSSYSSIRFGNMSCSHRGCQCMMWSIPGAWM